MKKGLKILGIVLGTLIATVAILWFMVNEKEPQGKSTAAADQLAEKMMAAVNKTVWDSTHWVSWRFQNRNSYIWDKSRDLVQVTSDDITVLLHTKSIVGKAYQNGQALQGKAEKEAIEKAWNSFCNDSFWLNPVTKAFDPGTTRSIVTLADDRKGLKVKYASGGVTPGDAYVWILDENNRPVAWKMWVQIIPVGGLEASWEDWTQLSSGAWISTTHEMLGRNIEMIQQLKAGTTLEGIGLQTDPFTAITNTNFN